MYLGSGTRFDELVGPRGPTYRTAIMNLCVLTCRSGEPHGGNPASHVPCRVGEHPHTPPPRAKLSATMNLDVPRRPGGQASPRYELYVQSD